MNIICKIFGHRPELGWSGKEGSGYMRISNILQDGTGIKHAHLTIRCRRCTERYDIGIVHLPKEED